AALGEPATPLFPYTTLFRSADEIAVHLGVILVHMPCQTRERGAASHAGQCLEQLHAGGGGLHTLTAVARGKRAGRGRLGHRQSRDRKSTRLNSSHVKNSYAA